MKVLFLITKATWGGAQRYVHDLAKHLPKSDFEVEVAYGESGKLTKGLSDAGIATHPLPSLGRDIAILSDISSFFEILVCVRKVRPDVIHLNSSKAAALGALAARILGVKRIIFTVHGWPFNEKRGEFARVMMYLVSWLTAFLSHAVIVVSKSDEAQAKKMRWIEKKIRYIPVGIESPAFLSRDEVSSSLSLIAPSPRIVTIAELTANKGIRYAIEAVGLLKQRGAGVSYAVIGDGEQRKELEESTAAFGVGDCVTFAGFIPDAARYLKGFDIFLLPSIKEGMPYVLLEAAAAGLPIVTTTVVNPDVLDTYSHIRAVPPGDPEALAEALLETMREKPEEELFPSQNLFSLSSMVQETAALYS